MSGTSLTGSVFVTGGGGGAISGSIHRTNQGCSYLVAGPNILINSASLNPGQIVIEATSAIPGPQGERGEQGLQGIQGPQGSTGSIGPQGLQGSQGDQGLQGLQGLQGEVGPQGLQGPQGDQGVQGAQGDPGTAGADGANGPGSIGFSGAGAIIDKDTIRYLGTGNGNVVSTEANAEYYFPHAATVQNLRVYVSVNTSNNGGNTVTLHKNGVATSMQVSYGASETGLKSDLSNSFAVLAGDRISIKVVNSATGGGTKSVVVESVSLELA